MTEDALLIRALICIFRKWGAEVTVGNPGTIKDWKSVQKDCVVLDVRNGLKESLSRLQLIRENLPLTEIVTINHNGNIRASLAGKRLGVRFELTVPIDMDVLKRIAKSIAGPAQSFSELFENTMSAVTFAEYGEYETASEMLNGRTIGNKERRIIK